MKRLLILLLLVVACGIPTQPEVTNPDGYTQYFEVPTPDRIVACISWESGYAGGLSCDWSER